MQYEVNPETYLIDYDKLEEEIYKFRPKVFIAGASAYPREIDFKRIRKIIDKINYLEYQMMFRGYKDEAYYEDLDKDFEKKKIYFIVDMAHIAGLVAAGYHQNPCKYADIVTTTTHKTLRGPRRRFNFNK